MYIDGSVHPRETGQVWVSQPETRGRSLLNTMDSIYSQPRCNIIKDPREKYLTKAHTYTYSMADWVFNYWLPGDKVTAIFNKLFNV